MDPHLAALVAAAREAMVNAAKHAGVAEVSVYAEIENGTASVFVRDRGKGFDPDAVGADRRGLAQSIRGRMDRHGGSADVRSAPGSGTEVVLTMPVAAKDTEGRARRSRRRSGDSGRCEGRSPARRGDDREASVTAPAPGAPTGPADLTTATVAGQAPQTRAVLGTPCGCSWWTTTPCSAPG